MKGSDGEVPLAVPRDRAGSFEPELVRKGQTRLDGIDDKIIGFYAAGLSVRDIQAHLRVAPDLISRVTNAVLEEVRDCLDLPGKSGEHQLRNQEVFYGQREQTDAGVSA